MNKSFFLIVIFFFQLALVFSQDLGGDSGDPSAGTEPQLPSINITPSNPETASLGRFGNVPVNTATGKMSFSVPIHNIQVDGGDWPISLEYSYNGLILETSPSMTGLGWNLNAYGSINRTVRGLPDGKSYGYYGVDSKTTLLEQYASAGFNDSVFSLSEFRNFKDGIYDMELDKYTVNVGPIQFSFKILKDDQGNPYPYYLSKHNNKVIINKDPSQVFAMNSFIVIDDKGVKYFFNSEHAEYPPADPSGTNPESEIDKNTAWVLSEIRYLNGESIYFEYESDEYFSWNFSASASIAKSLNVPGDNPTDSEGYETYARYYQHSNSDRILTRQMLKSILFPKGSIEVSTYSKNDHLLYDNIKLFARKSENGVSSLELVTTFDLFHEGERDCLTEIEKNTEHLYKFKYHNQLNLPPFYESAESLPLAQDYWHFYNGAVNNSAAFNLGGNYVADKNPNFSAALNGALLEIEYPTGGETRIQYEPNTISEISDFIPSENYPSYNKQISVELNPTPSNGEDYVYFEYTFDEVTPARVSYQVNGEFELSHLNLKLTRLTPSNNFDGYTEGNGCYFGPPPHTFPIDKLTDKANSLRTFIDEECTTFPYPLMLPTFHKSYEPAGIGGENTQDVYETSNQIYLEAGTYAFEISTLDSSGQPSFTSGHANVKIQIQFNDDIENQSADTNIFEKNVGGIRVAKIEDKPVDGQNTIREFKYIDPETGMSSGRINHTPLTSTSLYLNITEPDLSVNYHKEDYYTLSNFNYLNEGDGIPVYYSSVDIIQSLNGDEEYVFVPATGDILQVVEPEDQIPNDQNPSGRAIVTYLNPSTQSQSNPYVNVDGVIGKFVLINDPGFVRKTYKTPFESSHYEYPGLPKMFDQSKSMEIASDIKKLSEGSNSDFIATSTSSSIVGQYRHLIDPESNDYNNEHPWSYKLVLKKNRNADFNAHNYYYNTSVPEEIAAIKLLHSIYKYREVGIRHRIEETTRVHQGVSTTSSNEYLPNSNTLIKSYITSSTGEEISNEYLYPNSPELSNDDYYLQMTNINQVASPVQVTTYKDGDLLATQKNNFVQVQNGYKPHTIQTSKASAGIDDLEERIIYDSYDEKGNITQVKKADGLPTSYLWGYNKQYLVAQITGATFSEALSALSGTSYIALQSLDGDNLRNALQTIRDNLPNAQVTTYTYAPLIGMTSQKDPRGYTMYYEYDEQHRLKHVKDQDGNILSKNEYNYREND